jgi:hypothetical protein
MRSFVSTKAVWRAGVRASRRHWRGPGERIDIALTRWSGYWDEKRQLAAADRETSGNQKARKPRAAWKALLNVSLPIPS